MVRVLAALLAVLVPVLAGTPAAGVFERIGQEVEAQQRAPGFAMLVQYQGRVVFARGYGVSDIPKNTPVTPDTRFSVGSISKQFTAAAVLLLRDQGRLSLDSKLAKYLPQLPNAEKITLRMLLNQVSGLHNYPRTDEHNWPLQGSIDPQKLFAILATDHPDFEPGTKWAYSNTNYAALAEIAAQASGMPYGVFLKKFIFEPLGMTKSGSGFAVQAGIATPYEGSGKFTRQAPLSLDLFFGAGSIVSTAVDLARWDQALLEGKLLKPASRHEFWAPGQLADGSPTHYAMGWVPADVDGHREVWHNGFAPGAGGYCFNAVFPDEGLSVVVLSNSADSAFRGRPETIVRQVVEAFFPKL